MRTGGWGFERQGRRKHACLAAYPVAISPSAYSGSSVCSCLSLVSVHACICHLVSSRSLCFLRHRNMRALQRLPAFASACVRVVACARAIGACTCARIFLSPPPSLSTCEYIPTLTYTHTHIRTSEVAYKHAGTHVYIASTAPSAPGASTRGFQHTGTAHASGLHRRVAACIACYCEPARVLAEPRATICNHCTRWRWADNSGGRARAHAIPLGLDGPG